MAKKKKTAKVGKPHGYTEDGRPFWLSTIDPTVVYYDYEDFLDEIEGKIQHHKFYHS